MFTGRSLPLGVYPNTQKSGSQDRVQRRDHWHQFPLLRWDDDDKRDTVSNTKVSKWQTFSNKTLCRSCELSSKLRLLRKYGLLSAFAPLPLPYHDYKMEPKRFVSHKTSIYLRAPFKTQDVSSFLCASSKLSCWAGILVGDVWNLVVWVSELSCLTNDIFCGRRPLPFGGSHLRLPSGPAGIRTITGNLSALARPTPYQLSHRGVACCLTNGMVLQSRSLYGRHVSSSFFDSVFGAMMKQACRHQSLWLLNVLIFFPSDTFMAFFFFFPLAWPILH